MTVVEEEDKLNIKAAHQFIWREAIKYFGIGLDNAGYAAADDDEEEASSVTNGKGAAKKW